MTGARAEEPWTAAVVDAERWAAAERSVLTAAARDLARDLDEARRERDKAVQAVNRLRTRRSMRVATRVDERLLRGLRAARTAGMRFGISSGPAGPTVAPTPSAAAGSPASFRRTFLEGVAGRRLKIAVDSGGSGLPGEAEGSPAAALAAAGWPVVGGPAGADVVVVVDPVAPLRDRPRGPVVVAVVTDAAAVPDPTLLDDADLVLVPDAATAANLARSSSVAAEPLAAGDAPQPLPDRLAAGLADALRRWATGLRVGIAIGVPVWSIADTWGDLHFARAIQRQLERRGFATRVHILPDWADEVSARDDVAIHLFGLSERKPIGGQSMIRWVISHPDRVTPAMLEAAERTYVASDSVTERFRGLTSRPVAALHQATDPERFTVNRTGPRHAVLFVGNTRNVRRSIVEQIVPTSLDLAVYGKGWPQQFGDAAFVAGDHVPNAELNRWYGSAGVVLNDHWPDMRESGLLSNRLYDVLASGGFVISDPVAGIDEEFDGGVVTAGSAGELRWAIRDHLADPGRRRRLAERGRRAVLDRHTFGHRVETILADLASDRGGRPTPSRATGGAAA